MQSDFTEVDFGKIFGAVSLIAPPVPVALYDFAVRGFRLKEERVAYW